MDYEATYNRNRVTWLYAAARSKELSASAVRVGLLFATFFNAGTEREELNPSYEWIAETAHMSRATLAKSLFELEKAGFLTIYRIHRYRNQYAMPFTGDEVWKGPKSLSSKTEL